MNARRIAVLAAILALYLGAGIFDHGIWAPTEPAVSGVVWNMATHDALAVPRINDLPYLEKPPFFYWLAWLASRAGGGPSAGLIRLPAAILGLLCLGIVFQTVRRRHGETTALVTTLLGATSLELYELSHRASVDIAATAFVFACFGIFADTLGSRERAPLRRTGAHDAAFAFVLAASFYAKNFYTFLFVLPPVLGFLIHGRQLRRAAALAGMLALLTALLVAPWALALFREGGWEFLRIVFVDNTVGRFLPLEALDANRSQPLNDAYSAAKGLSPLYYPSLFFLVPQPWTLIFPAALLALFRKPASDDDYRRFLRIALVAVPLALTLSSSKASEYLTPLLFIMLLVMAGLVQDRVEGRRAPTPWERRLVAANLALVAAALLALPGVIWIAIAPDPLLLLVAAPALLLATTLWRQRDREAGGFAVRVGVLSTLAYLAAALVLFPAMDPHKSYRYFFEDVAPRLGGREVFTTLLDDRRLPLITYYLDRRVTVLPDADAVFARLEGTQAVALILPKAFYARHRERFGSVPHELVEPSRGREYFVLVANRP